MKGPCLSEFSHVNDFVETGCGSLNKVLQPQFLLENFGYGIGTCGEK